MDTAQSIKPDYTLTLTEDIPYYDHRFETASWYNKYVLHAGTYPIVMEPDYGNRDAIARIDATLDEEYRVNRLFTASKAKLTTPNRETTWTWRVYQYEIKPGAVSLGGQLVTIAEAAH